jgi:putative hydrolase of the HAD superfamily
MNDICVVFDVDDTLYLERDYVFSGFAAVGEWAGKWLGIPQFAEVCRSAHNAGHRGNIFDEALAHCGVRPTSELISTLVAIYRVHVPGIRLCADAALALEALAVQFPLAIVSDGPAISQSRKVETLGLNRFASPIVLTEIIGREFGKPHPRAFQEVQQLVKAHHLVYVADNPLKDFIAPRELGWSTIRIRRPEGLHAEVDGGRADFELPDCTRIEELIAAILQRSPPEQNH